MPGEVPHCSALTANMLNNWACSEFDPNGLLNTVHDANGTFPGSGATQKPSNGSVDKNGCQRLAAPAPERSRVSAVAAARHFC